MAVVAALLAGVPAVPLNPKVGERELAHIVSDSAPAVVLAEPGTTLPSGLDSVARLDVRLGATAGALSAEPDGEDPALIVYKTSPTRTERTWLDWRTGGSDLTPPPAATASVPLKGSQEE